MNDRTGRDRNVLGGLAGIACGGIIVLVGFAWIANPPPFDVGMLSVLAAWILGCFLIDRGIRAMRGPSDH